MKNIKSIKSVLQAIVALLKESNEYSWAKIFSDVGRVLDESPEKGFDEIVVLFGGSGSFNDLVLHRNSRPLEKENDQLQKLRAELFLLIH